MRVFRALIAVLLVISAASAAELKVRVVDPQSAAVANAQVLLIQAGESTVIATQTTNAEGIATFRPPAEGTYQIKVLAPGFAEQLVNATSHEDLVSVRLRLATTSETVVVSATGTPVPGEEAGADVAVLNGQQLQAMNPVAANDALRFLPG